MRRAKGDVAIIQTVARNVRAKSKAVSLSHEELAHEAGVDRTYVSQVERALRNLTISVLARIAKALKISPDKLLMTGVLPVSKRAVSSKNTARTAVAAIIIGLGATVAAMVFPSLYPKAPRWTIHLSWWGGIFLMIVGVLMLVTDITGEDISNTISAAYSRSSQAPGSMTPKNYYSPLVLLSNRLVSALSLFIMLSISASWIACFGVGQ